MNFPAVNMVKSPPLYCKNDPMDVRCFHFEKDICKKGCTCGCVSVCVGKSCTKTRLNKFKSVIKIFITNKNEDVLIFRFKCKNGLICTLIFQRSDNKIMLFLKVTQHLPS